MPEATLRPHPLVRWTLRLALWLSVSALLLLASDPYSPYYLRIRPWLLPGLPVLCAAGLGWMLWRLRAWRHAPAGLPSARTRKVLHAETAMLALGFAGALGLYGHQAWSFASDKRMVLAHTDSSAALATLGRHFIVGFRDFDEVAVLAARGAIAGVHLRSHNVHGRDPLHIRAEIMALQRLRERNGLPPLIVSADQEGGAVQHMSPPLPSRPSLAQWLAQQPAPGPLDDEDASPKASADALLAVYEYGHAQGAELQSLGINLNLGPVVDLMPEQAAPDPRDRHTRLHLRAISDQPHAVAEVASAYMRGLRHSGVHATLKHFPGLSRVPEDTHHFAARLDTPRTLLSQRDWVPFRQSMAESAAIMLAHVVLGDVDPAHPSALSPQVVDMLRHDWGYQGLLVTDDINMGALYHHQGICESTRQALNAGVDLVLLAYDSDQFYPAMACALRALERGELQLPHNPQTHQRTAALVRGSRQQAQVSGHLQLAAHELP